MAILNIHDFADSRSHVTSYKTHNLCRRNANEMPACGLDITACSRSQLRNRQASSNNIDPDQTVSQES